MADNTNDDMIIAIGVDLATIRRSMKRLEGEIGKSNRVIQQQYDKLGRDIDGSFNRAFRNASATVDRIGRSASDASMKIARVFAFAASARGSQTLIDTSIKIQNSLKVAGIEGENLEKVYRRLFASAQANGAPIDALATLYGRAATAAKELGASQEDLLQFSDGIAKALRVSGQSAQESSGALLQLSQALGGGKVQAEEYNSLLDGGRPILQAVAAGLKEAGGSVAALTKLVKDGKVSSKAFFDAFLAGQPVLEKALAGSEQTISSRFVRLQNVLVDAAGRFNQTATAGNAFGEAIDSIADEIANADFNKLGTQLKDIAETLQGGTKSLRDWAEYLGRISGLRNIGSAILPEDGISVLGGALTIKPTATREKLDLELAEKRRSIERDIATLKKAPASEDTARTIAKLEAQLKALPEIKKAAAGLTLPAYMLPGGAGSAPLGEPKEIKTVTLSDYPLDDDKASEKARKKYDDLVSTARERNEELRLEIDLIGQSGNATEAARNALELLQRAKRAGIEGENLKAIEEEAETYRKLATTLAEVKLQQDLLNAARFSSLSKQDQQIVTIKRQYGMSDDLTDRNAQAIRQSLQGQEIADDFKSFAMQFSTGLISEGKSLGEAFGDAVKAAAADQMQKSLESLFSQIGSALASALMPKLGGGAAGASPFAATTTLGALLGAGGPAAKTATGGNMSAYMQAIKDIESSGGNYGALGPITRNGDRAYGAYQVMGNNIGPWSQDALGRTLSADEFLKNPALQDQIFAHKFGGYVDKFGPSGAAQAWFGGPGSVGKGGLGQDMLGTSGNSYVKMFETNVAKMGSVAGEATKGLGGLNGGLQAIAQNFGGAGGGFNLAGLFSSSFKPNTTLSNFLSGIPGFDGGGNTGMGARSGGLDGKGGFLALMHPRETVTDHTKVNAPRAPRLNPSGGPRMVRNETSLTVQIQGASGDDHVRMLVNQGVQTALRDQNEHMRRQGFGNIQQAYTTDRG